MSTLMEQFASNNDQRLALQFAFYNVSVLALALLCCAGLFAIYKMMSLFLTPLLWATLIGTMLFPLKKCFNTILNGWLAEVEENNTPVVAACLLMPFNMLNKIVYSFFDRLSRRDIMIIATTYMILKILSHGTFISFIHLFGDLYEAMDNLILVSTKKWVSVIMLLYFAAYAGWLYVQDSQTVNKKFARLVSAPLWLFGLTTVASFCGPFRVIVMIVMCVVLIIVITGIVVSYGESDRDVSYEEDKAKRKEDEAVTKKDEAIHDEALSGDFYVQAIFALCMLEFIAHHDSVVHFIAFLGLLIVVKRGAFLMFTHSGLSHLFKSLWQSIYAKVQKIAHITVAGPLRNYIKVIFSSDQLIKDSLRGIFDDLSTVLVMLFVVLGATVTILVIGFQVHSELVHLVKLGANVLSQQPDWMGYAKNYTGDHLHEADLDDYVEQGYLKGREWLGSNLRSFINTEDSDKADMLVKQIIEVLDRLYRMWEERNAERFDDTADIAQKGLLEYIKSLSSIHTMKDELIEIVKANIDTLLNLLQSSWSLIAANVSILSTMFISTFGLIISFGMDIINLFIEIIVFLTALYYLLASSHDVWLPLKWISDAVPHSLSSGSYNSYNTAHISAEIENAISGVFVLSAKMSMFYGLYTYFIHSLFGINVVFIPSILAALFAAIPVMAPHLVCVFGVVQLYFVDGEKAAAICFILASFAPKAFADSAFYQELKGSHPYVTGLAIVGGIYWLGLQGAIIGPIILCSMIVMLRVYSKVANA